MAKARKFSFKNKPISIFRVLPNILTLVGLCVGLSSVRFALDNKWELAVLCIIVAAIIDGIDGKIARLLNATSTFGAELDSLCDAINFGIAPALVTYLWTFHDYSLKVVSWGTLLLFSVCMVLRLARFNTMAITASENKILNNFFVGIPAPAGGILLLLPLIHEFDLKEYTGFSFMPHPLIISLYQSILGILLASKLPTFSLKNISIDPKDIWIYLISAGIIIISVFLYPWIMLPIFGIIYLGSFPFSYLSWKKRAMSYVDNK